MKAHHPPAFLFYPDDFSSDGKVEAMSTEEVGAYMLLLCKSWREKPPGSIPSDDSLLAKWARLPLDRWLDCRTRVLAAFTFGTDSRWHQKRLRREYDKLKAIRKEKTKAANTRWGNNLHEGALQVQSFPSSSTRKPKTPLPPADAGEPNEQFFSWSRETIGVQMGRRKRLPSLTWAAGAHAGRVVEFLNGAGFPARIVQPAQAQGAQK